MPLQSVEGKPLIGRNFLPKAEGHALQRFAAQLARIGYAIGGQGDEGPAKLDFQFLRLPIVRRNVRIERPPNGVERFLDGVERSRSLRSSRPCWRFPFWPLAKARKLRNQ